MALALVVSARTIFSMKHSIPLTSLPCPLIPHARLRLEKNTETGGFHRRARHGNRNATRARTLHELSMPILLLNLVPEPFDLALGSRFMCHDVVKSDQASLAHQRRVHFKIAPNPFVGVVGIHEKIIQWLILKESLYIFLCLGRMRVCSKQMQLLPESRESPEDRYFPLGVSSSKWSLGQVYADDFCARRRNCAEQQQRASIIRSDFQAALGRKLL